VKAFYSLLVRSRQFGLLLSDGDATAVHIRRRTAAIKSEKVFGVQVDLGGGRGSVERNFERSLNNVRWRKRG
jgi:hypothetical protein